MPGSVLPIPNVLVNMAQKAMMRCHLRGAHPISCFCDRLLFPTRKLCDLAYFYLGKSFPLSNQDPYC